MKKNKTIQGQPVGITGQPHGTRDLNRDQRVTEKVIADVVALGQGKSLAGWDLLAQDIAIEEADRQRMVQGIPDLRAQAITALAYWTSLSRRVDSLNVTKNLLVELRAGPPLDTGGLNDLPADPTHD